MNLYLRVLLLSIGIVCHSISCQSDVGIDQSNVGSTTTQEDGSWNSSSLEVRYPSKAGLTCLLAIRRRILHTYKPFFDNFQGNIALIDTAAHANVGDNILWLGAKELMAHFGRTPMVLCAGDQWHPQQTHFRKCPSPEDLLVELGDPALIFYHPGGNFGDVWPGVQNYRNHYIADLDKALLTNNMMADWNVTLTQLPQTIHYINPTTLQKDGDLYGSLSKLHFSVAARDANGLKMGQHNLQVPVFACPDMAFMLGPAQAVTESSVDVLLLIREDHEGTMRGAKVIELAEQHIGKHGLTYKSTDWPGANNVITNRPQELYSELADLRWQLGLRIISAGRILVTNRLHATVIGVLLGIPTFYYDSLSVAGYGKAGGAMHMARKSSEACTEMALRSWEVTAGSEVESAEVAMTRAAKYFLSRSAHHGPRSGNL